MKTKGAMSRRTYKGNNTNEYSVIKTCKTVYHTMFTLKSHWGTDSCATWKRQTNAHSVIITHTNIFNTFLFFLSYFLYPSLFRWHTYLMVFCLSFAFRFVVVFTILFYVLFFFIYCIHANVNALWNGIQDSSCSSHMSFRLKFIQ